MIPILYEKTENDFTTYGIGALSDVVSCIVSEERNGQYELVMTYPISGKQYDEIQAERIIKAKAKPLGDEQLFRIYRLSKPIRGIVTIYAQHISYDLSGDVVLPFTGTYTPQQALTAVLTNTGFTAHTDKSGSKTFGTDVPKSARSMLGGTEGSVLDQWGGEYKWDNFDVYLNTNRGMDKDVVIEYGKNLTELVADHDLSEVYSELLPYAIYTDDTGSHTVTGDPIAITSVITRTKTLIKDFSYDFDGPMTKAQVNTKAASWLSDNPLGYETPSLTVSFINLSAPVNYPAAAATIDLCDTVTIRYTALGVDVKAKVVSCEYDTLLERYTRLTIGKPRASMTDTVANLTDQAKAVADYPALWKSAIEVATQMITGNAGGNVVLHEGPDGKPFELLIMDDPDITQATKVWRWTLGGLGYSTNGYSGPYTLAITADGKINADFIRTGRLIISDAADNTLFDADINTNKVYIAGFTVTDNGLDYSVTEPSGTGVLAGHTNTAVIHVGTDGVERSVDAYQQFYDDLEEEYVAGEVKYSETIGNGDTNNTGFHAHYEIVDDGSGLGYPSYTADARLTGIQLAFDYESPGEVTVNNTTVNADGMDTALNNAHGHYGTYISMSNSTYSLSITASGPTVTREDGTTSLATSGSWRNLGSISLTPGTWLITAIGRFAANATGRRTINLSSSSGGSTSFIREAAAQATAASGGQTMVNICFPYHTATSRTLYLNGFQNSGGSLSVDWAYDIVRLA